MKWMPTDAQSGDMVRIQIGTLFHYGVFVSEDEVIQFGWPPVPEYADRNEDIAVCAVDIDAFSCGRFRPNKPSKPHAPESARAATT